MSARSSAALEPNQEERDLSRLVLPRVLTLLAQPFEDTISQLRKQFIHLFSARSPVSYFIILTATAQNGLSEFRVYFSYKSAVYSAKASSASRRKGADESRF